MENKSFIVCCCHVKYHFYALTMFAVIAKLSLLLIRIQFPEFSNEIGLVPNFDHSGKSLLSSDYDVSHSLWHQESDGSYKTWLNPEHTLSFTTKLDPIIFEDADPQNDSSAPITNFINQPIQDNGESNDYDSTGVKIGTYHWHAYSSNRYIILITFFEITIIWLALDGFANKKPYFLYPYMFLYIFKFSRLLFVFFGAFYRFIANYSFYVTEEVKLMNVVDIWPLCLEILFMLYVLNVLGKAYQYAKYSSRFSFNQIIHTIETRNLDLNHQELVKNSADVGSSASEASLPDYENAIKMEKPTVENLIKITPDESSPPPKYNSVS